ncbi:MAG: hypothetical protein LUE27_00325 [Clostridia bacterium]|nr:hypothetical protein [Clostridia bacterium]
MAEIERTLGLHQRIPIDILAEYVREDLSGDPNPERLAQLISTEYVGENRQKKGVHQIKTTINMNPVMDFCREHKEDVLTAFRTSNDENLILAAIIAGRYKFCYEAYCAMSKLFRIQDTVTSALLLRTMAAKYGANKSIVNVQINTLAQMLQTGLIVRIKPGVYKAASPIVSRHKITGEIWKECFYANNPLASRDDFDSFQFEPFFRYIDLSFI